MKNSDMPAMSNDMDMQSFGMIEQSHGKKPFGIDQYRAGLTKLEYFTAKALQGLLANPSVVHFSGTNINCEKRVSAMAVNYAEEALRELRNS